MAIEEMVDASITDALILFGVARSSELSRLENASSLQLITRAHRSNPARMQRSRKYRCARYVIHLYIY
jgi:hypothetical protein